MALRERLRRLERDARGNMDWLDLQDGSRYYFEPMEVYKDLFLESMDKGFRDAYEDSRVTDLSEGPYEPPQEPRREPSTPPIREALAKATPESLARFEEHYGPAERGCAVIHNDGT